MSQCNIDNFNKATLFILSHLYDCFPNRIEIDSVSLTMKELVVKTGSHLIHDGDEDLTREGGELDFLNYLTNTILWLEEEKYVRFDSFLPPNRFKEVILSNKGLVLLGRPSSLCATEKLVDSIKSEFKKGAAKGIQELGQQLIQSGVSKFLIKDD